MIVLKKEDCYCSLEDFYGNVARKMGITPVQQLTAAYSSTKICVTQPVQDVIWAFYRDTVKASDTELAMFWVLSGPKTSLKGSEFGVEVEDGFILTDGAAAEKFSLGELVATASVAGQMESDEVFCKFVGESLCKFLNCDWGEMCDDDKKLNDCSLKNNPGRLHGVYISIEAEETIWIITEADRSVTTILFPEEY